MSDQSQTCPQCQSPYGYFDGTLWICPECAYEWTDEMKSSNDDRGEDNKFKDANGVELSDGDCVRVTKDLKLGKEILKSGTKVKGIRLLSEPVNGHDIACKVQGFGSIYLKCSVVKKDS